MVVLSVILVLVSLATPHFKFVCRFTFYIGRTYCRGCRTDPVVLNSLPHRRIEDRLDRLNSPMCSKVCGGRTDSVVLNSLLHRRIEDQLDCLNSTALGRRLFCSFVDFIFVCAHVLAIFVI